MTGQLELFNTLTIIFLIGGILCAVAALFIFMRSGIREYFVLKHHDVNKDIEKETNGILEDIESEPEDHSVVNPSEILGKPAKVSNDEKPTEKQESCKGQLDDGSEKEDGAGETIATNTGKAQTKATSTHDENVEDDIYPTKIGSDYYYLNEDMTVRFYYLKEYTDETIFGEH